jgi:hypothetical protein
MKQQMEEVAAGMAPFEDFRPDVGERLGIANAASVEQHLVVGPGQRDLDEPSSIRGRVGTCSAGTTW